LKLPEISGLILYLLPAANPGQHYSDIIKKLAHRYQSYPFIPHITISRVPDWEKDQIKSAVDDVAAEVPAFDLPVKAVHCGDHPYQKITVEVKKTAELTNISDKLDDVFGGAFSKREYPHLSLHYSTRPCDHFSEELEKLESEIRSPINIDKLALIKLTETPDRWQVIYSRKLAGDS
jgi:2'-5' RNA ligase